MGRDKTKKIEELNDDDAIRQRESSLALNIKEHMKIADEVFNDNKDENEEQNENTKGTLEMNIKENDNNKNKEKD